MGYVRLLCHPHSKEEITQGLITDSSFGDTMGVAAVSSDRIFSSVDLLLLDL